MTNDCSPSTQSTCRRNDGRYAALNHVEPVIARDSKHAVALKARIPKCCSTESKDPNILYRGLVFRPNKGGYSIQNLMLKMRGSRVIATRLILSSSIQYVKVTVVGSTFHIGFNRRLFCWQFLSLILHISSVR